MERADVGSMKTSYPRDFTFGTPANSSYCRFPVACAKPRENLRIWHGRKGFSIFSDPGIQAWWKLSDLCIRMLSLPMSLDEWLQRESRSGICREFSTAC